MGESKLKVGVVDKGVVGAFEQLVVEVGVVVGEEQFVGDVGVVREVAFLTYGQGEVAVWGFD